MTCRKKFISVWNEINKFLSFMDKRTAVGQLNDTTAFPWVLNFSKNFSANYRKCKSNRWDYLISIHAFKNSNGLMKRVEEDPIYERSYLIKKYNERLLFYSKDKINPWIIDDRNDICLVLNRKNYLEFETKFQFLKEKDSVRFYSLISIWEKINKFIIKNKAMQFFYLLWSGFISHANLLNWISFLLLLFSLSLYSYPVIFLMLGISLVSYLIVQLVFLVKKNSIILPKINPEESEQILESLKIEIFNEEKNKHEFKLIHEIVFDFSKKVKLHEILNSISAIQKNFDPIYYTRLGIKQSKLYQYLTEVYPKTQFIASLMVNLISVILYTYLLLWAIQSCLIVLGAVCLAGIISSPVAVGSLILIAAGVFLIHHFCEFLAREVFYQRTILNRMDEKCEYHYKDEQGKQQVIQLEKWKKFEYLQDNICYLQLEFKTFFKKNNLNNLHDKFYSVFNSLILKKNVYCSSELDKVLGKASSAFKIVKKLLNRFFAFSGGGFYGYNLSQQIVWKSKLGLHILSKTLTLPIVLIIIPLIVINGIANLITYHFHSRQLNRFEMAKNLDIKLESLEQTNKKLLFLAALLSLELKHASDPVVNLIADLESDLLLVNKNVSCKKKPDHFSFFKKNSQKIDTVVDDKYLQNLKFEI